MTPILILAAGQSSRMRGADKLMMHVDDMPLLQRQVNLALHISKDVRVALPPAPHPRHTCIPPAARKIEVPDAATGISASLRRLVGTLEPDITKAMILLCDLPALQASDLQKTLDASQRHPDATVWRGATAQGKPGHPLVISAALFPAFQQLQGDTGGQAILKAHRSQTHLVALPGNRALLDLDTPEDWAAWRSSTAD